MQQLPFADLRFVAAMINTTEPMEGYKLGFAKVYHGCQSKNRGKHPPNHPFVHRVFHDFHHPFWGVNTTIFGNIHMGNV